MLHAVLTSIETKTNSTHKESANKLIDAHLNARDSAIVYSAQLAGTSFSKEKENPPSITASGDYKKIKSKNLPHDYDYYFIDITAKKKTVFSTTVEAEDRQQAFSLVLDHIKDLIHLTPDKPNPPSVTINSLTVTYFIEIIDIPFPEKVQVPTSFTGDIKPRISHRAGQHTADESLETWRTAVTKSFNLSPIESAYVFFKPCSDPHDSTSRRISEAIAMRNLKH